MQKNKEIVQLKTVTNACAVCHAKDLCMASCLSEEDHRRFEQVVGHRAPLNRGERIFMAGDKLNSIFILHSGSVKTYVESSDGDNQITGFHLPGDVIGFHGVEKSVHSDTVEALETSSVCELQFTSLEEFVAAYPTLQKPLSREIFKELSHGQDMLLVLGKMSAERRMAYFLLDISDRLAAHGRSSDHINLTMTRHDIGNYLGLAVETVSRLLTRFQKQDIIEVQRRSVFIKDSRRLEAIFSNEDDGSQTLKHAR